MLIEKRRSRRLMNQINVVPYIDVMLVLLVIFMVTAPLINPGQVELPSIGKSSNPPVAPMEVSIRTDQSLWLRDRAAGGDDRKVSRNDLVAADQAETGEESGAGRGHRRRQGRALRVRARRDGHAAAEPGQKSRLDGKAARAIG